MRTRPLHNAALTLVLLGCARDDWRDLRNAARADASMDVPPADAPPVDAPLADAPPADASPVDGSPADAPPRVTVAQMVSSEQVTFARTSDGRVYAAGRNAGAFEGFDLSHRNTFVRVEGIEGAEQLSVASREPTMLCARRGDGTVACKQGSAEAITVKGLTDARQISGRCALRANGEVACWSVSSLEAAPVADLRDVVSVAGDGALHCAILRGGAVSCWGAVGNVMDMTPSARVSATPEPVSDVTSASALGVGRNSVCAALTSGSVKCWGRRSEINLGSAEENTPPVSIVGARGAAVRAVTSNAALREDGSVVVWASGASGTRGDGTYNATSLAVAVPGVRARTLMEGDTDRYVCAVGDDGVASCWGDDGYGQLGRGGGLQRWPLPALANPEADGERTPLDGVTDAMLTAVAACALRSDRTVWCWGAPENGILGDGTVDRAPAWRLTPARVAGLTGVASLLASGSTARDVFGAVLDDQTARLWGNGAQGAIGDGAAQLRPRPTAPARLADVRQLSAGLEHACARRGDGSVWCWGRGVSGELGDGATANASAPVAVAGVAGVVDIALGPDVSLALQRDGSMRLWGLSASVLPVARANPTAVALPPLADVTGLITVMPHNWRQVCALRSNGRVSCIGDYLTQRFAWVDMGLEDVTQLAGSPASIGCARHRNGTVSCWGINRGACIGDPALPHTEDYVAPTLVRNEDGTPFNGVVSVRPGIGMVCAVREGGTLWCWGASDNGVMGRGMTGYSARVRPVIGL